MAGCLPFFAVGASRREGVQTDFPYFHTIGTVHVGSRLETVICLTAFQFDKVLEMRTILTTYNLLVYFEATQWPDPFSYLSSS